MFGNFWKRVNSDPEEFVRRSALLISPVVAVLMFNISPPAGLSQHAWYVAAICILMGFWWMTEAVPLAATALLPLLLFPVLNINSIEATAVAYANPLIFLFLGGFLLAQAMVKQHLSERLAFKLLSIGRLNFSGITASMMVATAFLSMWVSNTATTIVMLPIAQSIILAMQARVSETEKPDVVISFPKHL